MSCQQLTPRDYPMMRPPMTRIVSPVTYEDASEARKTHASAISSGRPSRRSGMSLSCAGSPGGGMADEDVDGAELGERAGDHRVDRGGVGDVGQRADNPNARLAARPRHRVELVAVGARVEDEVGAFRGERERDGAADVAAGAGDERGLALELHSSSMTVLGPCGRCVRCSLAHPALNECGA